MLENSSPNVGTEHEEINGVGNNNNNNNNLILILRAFHEMIKRALHDFYL